MAYDVGDKVKIWKVFGYPIGTVRENLDDGAKYKVEYMYQDGHWYTEDFEKSDLALSEKSYLHDKCQCGVSSTPSGGVHSDHCRKKGQTEKGIHDGYDKSGTKT